MYHGSGVALCKYMVSRGFGIFLVLEDSLIFLISFERIVDIKNRWSSQYVEDSEVQVKVQKFISKWQIVRILDLNCFIDSMIYTLLIYTITSTS